MVDYIAHLDADGRAVVDALRSGRDSGDDDRSVAACPGWTVVDLAGHLGFVWAMATHLVTTRPDRFVMPGPESSRPDDPAAVADWLDERRGALIDALTAVEPDEPMWTWTDRRDAGFYRRRMAMETAVHRWDAQEAIDAAAAAPVAFDLASDGIAELTEVGWRYGLSRTMPELPTGSLHLHATDGPGEWSIVNSDGSIVVTHEHAKGDAAVRGAAGDLFLWLWGRVGDGAVDIFGDGAVAHAWQGYAP